MTQSKKEPKINDISKMMEIAVAYYEKKQDQKKIAADMKISQSEVSRLLKLARDEGYIELKINLNTAYDEKLRIKLMSRYNLQDVVLSYLSHETATQDTERLLSGIGYQAAEYFIQNVSHAAKIGLSCGTTLKTLLTSIEYIKEERSVILPEKCKIYALLHPRLHEISDVTPASLVASLVRLLPGSKGIAYQFPDQIPTDKGLQKLRKDLTQEMTDLDIYIVGIGYIDYSDSKDKSVGLHFNTAISELKLFKELASLEAQGECNNQPFDKKGKFLIDTPGLKKLKEKLCIYLPLDVLKAHVAKGKKVVAIAGGTLKHSALHAALKAKIFNVLITDSLTASKLLDIE